VNETLRRLLNAIETGDHVPTPGMQAAYAAACKDLADVVTRFNAAVHTGAPLAAPRCGA
jgi:hypothetical protein